MKRLIVLITLSVFTACAVVRPVAGGGFTVEPASAQADPGQAIRFVLSAAQGAPPAVTWTVTGGGSITAEGLFTAPGCASTLPVTVTITATSGSASASAVVDVADKVTGVSIAPVTVTLTPGASQTFVATVKTACNPTGVASVMRASRAARMQGALVSPPVVK